MNDKPKTLAQRTHAIMQEVSYIKKRPKAGLPYPYVAHDDVTEALRDAFIKHGVLCLPSVVEERQEGNRCVLKVNIMLVNVDDISDQCGMSFVGHGVDSQDKGPGKALSYAVKIGLLKMLMIPTGERDVEQDQIEQTYLDKELLHNVMDAIEKEDGQAIHDLMHPQKDEVQMAVWRELNTATKRKARELLKVARDVAS